MPSFLLYERHESEYNSKYECEFECASTFKYNGNETQYSAKDLKSVYTSNDFSVLDI